MEKGIEGGIQKEWYKQFYERFPQLISIQAI
jgi:hypothetical protein